MTRALIGAQPTALTAASWPFYRRTRGGEVTDLSPRLGHRVSALGSVPCHLLAFLTHPVLLLCLLGMPAPLGLGPQPLGSLHTPRRVPDPSPSDNTQVSASSPAHLGTPEPRFWLPRASWLPQKHCQPPVQAGPLPSQSPAEVSGAQPVSAQDPSFLLRPRLSQARPITDRL